jgi:hypothetical protein
MPTLLNNIGGKYNAPTKPPIFGDIKDWTQSPQQGDQFWNNPGNVPELQGHDTSGWFPVWKTDSEKAQAPIDQRIKDLTDPNSSYYKSISSQIKNTLTGALSPDSLLALTVAMGGSPSQAKEQIKALQNKITDSTGNLTNQYYLAASNSANSLYGMELQNAQFNQAQDNEKDLYKQQKQDSLLNSILSGITTTVGTIAGGFGGKPKTSSSSSSLTPLQESTMTLLGQTYYGG